MKLIKSQEGVATLIAVTLTSFLILILTTGVTILMIGELRQSEDAENSAKAYYSAQSASENAIQQIKSTLKVNGSLADLQQSCTDTNGPGQPYTDILAVNDIKDTITCLSVQSYTKEVQSVLEKDQAVQFDLSNAGGTYGIGSVVLDWDTAPVIGSGPFPSMNTLGAPGANSPPVMEMTVTNYAPGYPTTVITPRVYTPDADGEYASTYTTTLVMLPQCSSDINPMTCTALPAQLGANNYSSLVSNDGPKTFKTQCYNVPSKTPRCQVKFNAITPQYGYRTVVSLRPRYGAASYRFKAFTPAGDQVSIPLASAQIDVTAKTGDSFRRVTVGVPVRTGGFTPSVLFGDNAICKSFTIYDGGGGSYGLNNSGAADATCGLDN